MLIKEIILNFIYLLNFLLFSFLSIKLIEKIFKIQDTYGENLFKASLIFSLALAVSPLYTGESYGLFVDLALIWIYSILAFILLIVGHFIVDNFIFHKVHNIEEIKKGNLALVISEGANFIATGIIVKTIIDNLFFTNISHIEFWIKLISIYLFIQLLLAISLYIYELYLFKVKNINIRDYIYKGNISSSILISSNYLLVSFLLSTAFTIGKTTLETVILTLTYFIISILILEAVRISVNLILLKGSSLKDLIEKDNYFKILYSEVFIISIIFIYHFLNE